MAFSVKFYSFSKKENSTAQPSGGTEYQCQIKRESGLINPEIIAMEGEQVGQEGCLSVPGRRGVVIRPNKVTVRAQDRNGEWFEAEGEELIGRCFCHELDHLDGIVYTEVMERFLTEEELEALRES